MATPSKDAGSETVFAELATRFAAASRGKVSPELSADLALEVVLNEIVEQACLATGATGAALVLERSGEMVCRASSGSTAPALGSRLDTASGLSGESIRTRQTQRCDDVLMDPRVDREASQRLGVRSVMVMPVIRGADLVGVLELFSSLPHAFGQRDELTLRALAGRIVTNVEHAARPLPLPPPLQKKHLPASEGAQEVFPESPELPKRRLDRGTWALGFAILACTVLLGVMGSLHLAMKKTTVRPRSHVPATVASTIPVAITSSVDARNSPNNQSTDAAVRSPSNSSKANDTGVLPGGLLVFEQGKEVFRLPPGLSQDAQNQNSPNESDSLSTQQESGMKPASSREAEELAELVPAAAEGSLLRRVEPEYPEDARQQQIQGAVVLEVHISEDGTVQDIKVVSGPPQLVQASIFAIKQWHFKPRVRDGRAVEMQTKITLNFRLPQ